MKDAVHPRNHLPRYLKLRQVQHRCTVPYLVRASEVDFFQSVKRPTKEGEGVQIDSRVLSGTAPA